MDNKQKQKAYLLIKLVEIYTDVMGCGGGNLHIVLADGNYDNDSIVVCFQQCIHRNDSIGLIMCKLLFEFSEKQREDMLSGFNNIEYELSYDEYQKTLKVC